MIPVEGVFAWGTQLRELNAWLRRAVTPGVPFVDPAHETAAERVRRKLLALTPSLAHLTDQLDIAAAHDAVQAGRPGKVLVDLPW